MRSWARAAPFADYSFDFATYTDVIEHHPFSPKRVLTEIHRILVPGGRLILATPNHASVYNRIRLCFGASVNDNFDYFFNTNADAKTYDGHHREYTRAEIRSALEQTGFRVLECRVIDDDLGSLLNYRRRAGHAKAISDSRDFVMRSSERFGRRCACHSAAGFGQSPRRGPRNRPVYPARTR